MFYNEIQQIIVSINKNNLILEYRIKNKGFNSKYKKMFKIIKKEDENAIRKKHFQKEF